MQQLYKRYFSVFLLFLFLLPQIEKGIHDWHHRKDTHCSVKNETHFHEQEHSCTICDYTIPAVNEPADTYYSFLLSVRSICYSFYSESFSISETHYQLPPRAPPIV